MDYKALNEVLSNINHFRRTFTRVDLIDISKVDESYPIQGHVGEVHEIYEMPGTDDAFIKFIFVTDSYGSNEYLSGIQFVKPATKTITTYETI